MMLDKQNCENKMFSYIVDEILFLRAKYALKFSSFAILVKDKFQQRNLLNFLENRKISANAKSTKYLADSEVLNHLRDLFSAIKNCNNERKIKKVCIFD